MKELPACLDLTNLNGAMEDDCQVIATQTALDLLAQIQAHNRAVSIHHKGGYANGADTLCLPFGEMRTGYGDVLLGMVQSVPIFGRVTRDWDDRQFVLDAIVGNCGSFSLESGTGKRFFVRSQDESN